MNSLFASAPRARALLLAAGLSLATTGLLFGAVSKARADMAPLPSQAGASFGVAGPTDIRLVSETVLIQVVEVPVTWAEDVVITQTAARVTADFLLDNPDAGPQSLQVGFPLDIPAQAMQSGGEFARLHGL